ncbi:MAG: NADH-quinone oxidoreductase subunit N [Chloroflexi bacterium]|nr:NADH-quinone oxidoreductase subunit N [Chloroflexota bacterium]
MSANVNVNLLTPEFILAGMGLLVLSLDLVLPKARRGILPWIGVAGLIAAVATALIYRWDRVEELYGGVFIADRYSLFFFAFLVILGGAVMIASVDYVKQHIKFPGEYYGILIFSILGMVLMASAGELLTAYIAMELLSFSLYVLVALRKYDSKSNESAAKYILLGAFSSAIMLYGISMVWGVTGTTFYDGIAAHLTANPDLDIGLIVGLSLIVAGLGFKVAAVPFHMWAPDVYEGAPTPVTAYLAIGSKAAAFALILRLFSEGLLPAIEDWRVLIATLAAATMVLGNLVAIRQENIKRMLAYSSIGQVGYLLLGVASLGVVDAGGAVVFSERASTGIMVHLVGYAVANLAAFLVVAVVYSRTGSDQISDYRGLAKKSPYLSLVLSVALFSLAGLPFFAGFVTKFYLFTAGAEAGFLWLSGLAMVASLVSLYYYLRVIQRAYVDQPSEGDEETAVERSTFFVPLTSWLMLGVLFVGMILIGVWPTELAAAADSASDALGTVRDVSTALVR